MLHDAITCFVSLFSGWNCGTCFYYQWWYLVQNCCCQAHAFQEAVKALKYMPVFVCQQVGNPAATHFSVSISKHYLLVLVLICAAIFQTITFSHLSWVHQLSADRLLCWQLLFNCSNPNQRCLCFHPWNISSSATWHAPMQTSLWTQQNWLTLSAVKLFLQRTLIPILLVKWSISYS